MGLCLTLLLRAGATGDLGGSGDSGAATARVCCLVKVPDPLQLLLRSEASVSDLETRDWTWGLGVPKGTVSHSGVRVLSWAS